MGYGGKQAIRSGDIRRFNFTGNGSNTAFDLGFTPATQNQLIVTVNGLVQHYDAFSVTGSTLTFTGTPASGDTIQVTAVVDAVGVAAIPDGAIANVSTLTVSGNTTLNGILTATANVNIDSGTLFVDGTNNRVGINNTAPTSALTVTGAAAFSSTLAVTGNISTTSQLLANGDIKGITATNPTIWSSNSASLTDGSMYMQFNTTSSEGRLGSYTNHPLVLLTNNTRQLIIDTAGRVTMPYQPVFIATVPTAIDLTYSTTHNISQYYTGIDINRGSHYNVSNGRFTAPVTGLYSFNWTYYLYPIASTEAYLYVNNSPWIRYQMIFNYSSNTNPGGNRGSAILYLTAGDYVTLHMNFNTVGGSNASLWNGGPRSSHWSGYLIG